MYAVEVPLLGDQDVEPNEVFHINLSDVSNATIADGQGEVTIVNDDPNGVVVAQTMPYHQDYAAGLPSLSDGWMYYRSYGGHISMVNGSLRMEDTGSGGRRSLDEAVLHMNLAGSCHERWPCWIVGRQSAGSIPGSGLLKVAPSGRMAIRLE